MTAPEKATCRLCSKPIAWVEIAGRRKPYDLNPDGTLAGSHFLTCIPYRTRCAERDSARKREREAEEERRQGRLF